jgi:hypothetical protein
MHIKTITTILGCVLGHVLVSLGSPVVHVTGVRLPVIAALTQTDGPLVCEWPRHCRGSSCSSADDCSGDLVCVNTRCDDQPTTAFQERFSVNDTLNFIPVAYDAEGPFFYDALLDPERRDVTFRQRNVQSPSRVNWISSVDATSRYDGNLIVGRPGSDLYELGASGGTAGVERVAFVRRYSRKDGSRRYSFSPRRDDCPFPERVVGEVHPSGDLLLAVVCLIRDDLPDDLRNTVRVYRLSNTGSVEWSKKIEGVYGGSLTVALDPAGRRFFVTWSRIRRMDDGDVLDAYVALYRTSNGSKVAGPLQIGGIRSVSFSGAVDGKDLIISGNAGTAASRLFRLRVEERDVRTKWAVDIALPNVRPDVPADKDADLLFLCAGGNGKNAVLQARELDDGTLAAEKDLAGRFPVTSRADLSRPRTTTASWLVSTPALLWTRVRAPCLGSTSNDTSNFSG